MGNNILPKMKDSSASTVPRAIVKGNPKAKYQRQKTTLPQDAAAEAGVEVAVVEENVRKLIQKTKNRFRHFVFTETSPSISPADLVGKALTVVPGVYRVGTSYVLYSHDTRCTEECTYVRGSVGRGIHYHLMLRSADPVLETLLIKKVSDAFVYIKNSFYQVHVQCPLTTYYELHTDETTALVANVGGEIFDMFERVIQRGALKPLTRVKSEPVWESHKHSQILAQEQLIALVRAGSYSSVVYLCIYLCIYLFIYLCIYLFMYLFVYVFICLFIYLCIYSEYAYTVPILHDNPYRNPHHHSQAPTHRHWSPMTKCRASSREPRRRIQWTMIFWRTC
jgi:hypothetical protein